MVANGTKTNGMRRNLLILSIGLISLVMISCATNIGVSKRTYTKNQQLLRDGMNQEVVQAIKSSKDEYKEKDEVLYYLDLGLVEFYSQDYNSASKTLGIAEKAIETYGISSVTENTGALIQNDYAIAYPGEKYEEVLADTFAAISYQMMGDSEGAMVEVRQAEIKLNDFKANAKEQQVKMEKLVLGITSDPFKYFSSETVGDFTGSAFIDYVSMLMYRGRGDLSNALVDYRRIKNRVKYAEAISSDEVEIPSGMARVNLISLEGIIGFKNRKAVLAATPGLVAGGTVSHKVTWAGFEPGYSDVVKVTLSCSDGTSVETKEIEDFNALAVQTLALDVRSVYLKSFYRGYTKMVTAMTAGMVTYKLAMKAADEAYESATASGNPVAKIAASAARKIAEKAAKTVYNEALDAVNDTEIADTRMAQFFPARASVAGLTLAPGVYDFEIRYTLRDGSIVTKTFSSYEVREGVTNLLLGTCAR